MSDETLVPLASLEERVRERIHESIGELITEKDLEELIRAGIERTFFKRSLHQVSDGWQRTKQVERPAMIETILADLLADTIRTVCDQWIVDHEDAIRALMTECVTNGAGRAVLHVFNQVFASTVREDYVDARLHQLFQ